MSPLQIMYRALCKWFYNRQGRDKGQITITFIATEKYLMRTAGSNAEGIIISNRYYRN